MLKISDFPDNFKWGAATAAYQIEGAAAEEGRGPSIWDTFSHLPGKTHNGDTGDVADDHYHRWQTDIQLMRQLGLNSYRFSISWSRVLPAGVGAVNPAGLAFYDRLVDGLLEAGIAPAVTLYHWDLPQALEDKGGWANRSVVDAFAEYAGVVVRQLGDRVKQWITLNEPQVYTFAGYETGRHAPGQTDIRLALKAVHNTMLAHGRAVPILRAGSPNAEVGVTLNLHPFYPATPTLADKLAAHLHEAIHDGIFLDPIFGNGYPPAVVDYFGDLMPEIMPNDLTEIAAPLDFLGINYYFPVYSKLTSAGENSDGFRQLEESELIDRGFKQLTHMGWPVMADGLLALLRRVHHQYAPKAIYITENGSAYPDQVIDGQVNDIERILYLIEHLEACATAIQDGIPLKGYYVWSLLDNFEWARGYDPRFGIIYVDYATQQRLPKQSYYYYQQFLAGK